MALTSRMDPHGHAVATHLVVLWRRASSAFEYGFVREAIAARSKRRLEFVLD